MVIWLANCGTAGVPPATLGAPVSYGDGRTGAPAVLGADGAVVAGRADAAGVTGRANFACFCLGLGAVTLMLGSRVLSD
jgi:hypothetical protein